MKKLLGIALLAFALPALLIAADKVDSGLKVGSSVPAFNVRDVTGPSKGDTLCYRCKYGARPVVTVFTRNLTDDVKSFVKKVDQKVGDNKDKKMAAFVVVLTNDPDAIEPKLTELAKAESIKNTPLTFIEGEAGPESYKLSKDAEVTVMMWVDNKLTSNTAYAKGKFDAKAAETLLSETSKILE